jgi:alcohol dehydrogenase class IV
LSFTWRDGERVIRFGPAEPIDEPYVLLSTERAADRADFVEVPSGKVDEISAQLLDAHDFDPGVLLLARGGGRVIDTAKAIAGAIGGRCAAIPTTLSGAEMTGFHRTPAGVEGARLVRPILVLADPELMASAPEERLAASAMNALAHAMEALYTPLANPVATMAALRATSLLTRADREEIALGALLAGYASGSTGIAVHHAICQTIVRECGTPHAETNAVMLPHSARLMAPRAPEAVAAFEGALGVDLAELCARSGHVRLSTLGVSEQQLPTVAEAVASHRLLANTPDPPGAEEILALLRDAL